MFEGYYQLDVLYFINTFLNNKGVFIDIGGHHGLMSVIVAKKDKANKVYTFEPNPNALKYLYQNINLNKLINIEVVELPVYDKKENVTFYIHQGNVSWNSTIVKEFAYSDIPTGNTITEIEKETIVLDDFIKKRNIKPDLIKIDVEGAEINVLKGGLETIKVNKPAIIMEFNPLSIESAKLTIRELIDMFDDLNYKIIILKRNLFGYYNIKNHTVFNPKKHCKNGKIANVICIEKSKLESLVK